MTAVSSPGLGLAAEAALVARILVDPRQLPLVKVGPEDFSSPLWRAVYAGMTELQAQHRSIDIVALQAYAQGENLSGLISEVSPYHRGSAGEYADMIRQAAFRRRLIGRLDRVIRRAEEETDNETLVAELQEAVAAIAQSIETGGLISPEKAVDAYERIFEKRLAHGGMGLDWGIPALDRMIQPAQGGDMVVLAARPSVGKTTLAEIMADKWALKTDKPVLFVSLEMSTNSLIDRSISRYAGIDGTKILRGELTPPELERAREIVDYRRRVKVWYLGDGNATTASVRAAAAQVKLLAGGIAAVVVDYLQLLKDPGDQEVQRVTRISRQVKAIALEFDVPILALSQLSRASVNRDDPHPKLHDLRESGAIEQDADLVFGLWRPLDSRIVDLEVLKNRATGAVGRVSLEYEGLTA